jgi:hypothetical protein
MTDRLQLFTEWLAEYVDRPIDPALIKVAEGRPSSAADLVTLGHSYALVAVAGAIKGLLSVIPTKGAPRMVGMEQEFDPLTIFRSVLGLREAGAGGSNPLTPTSKIKDIDFF